MRKGESVQQGPTAGPFHCAEAIEVDLPVRRVNSGSDVEENAVFIYRDCVHFVFRML
jgi:hypothetical protein